WSSDVCSSDLGIEIDDDDFVTPGELHRDGSVLIKDRPVLGDGSPGNAGVALGQEPLRRGGKGERCLGLGIGEARAAEALRELLGDEMRTEIAAGKALMRVDRRQ